MAPKRKGRKAATAKRGRTKKVKDPFAEEKKLKLDSLLVEFDQNVENHCNAMKHSLVTTCSNIQVLYDMAFLTIPTMYHNMTKEQYEEKKKAQSSDIDKIVDDGISKMFDLPSIMSRYESCLASTAKKKKIKKFIIAPKTQKKFSKDSTDTSVASSIRTTRRALAKMQETVTPVSRQQGFIQKFTPKTKKSSSFFNAPLVVTPKFDPRKPWGSSLLRKPKAGEVVMSMSGSPLLIPSADDASKPGIMVSLGGGKVLNVADASGLNGIEMSLDQSTKRTLQLVNEKLSKVLAS